MRQRLAKILRFGKEFHSEFQSVKQQLEKIDAKQHDTLVVCLENTGNSYLGIKIATFNLFSDNILVIPAYYSHINLTPKQQEQLASQIVACGFKQIIFSALPASLNGMVGLLQNKITIKVIFHGTLSELSTEKNEKQLLNVFKLCHENVIQKIGFVKSGLPEWCSSLFGFQANWLALFPLKKRPSKPKISSDQIHVGVFANTSFNKNLYNQVAAALAIPNTVVHTFADSAFLGHFFSDRIKKYPLMPHDEFVDLLASMHVNLHLSFSESTGGQVFMESIAQGVPCLTSYNNEFLKHSEYLTQLLIVDQYDNPWQIKKAVEHVLQENQEILSEKMVQYAALMHDEAANLLAEFTKN